MNPNDQTPDGSPGKEQRAQRASAPPIPPGAANESALTPPPNPGARRAKIVSGFVFGALLWLAPLVVPQEEKYLGVLTILWLIDCFAVPVSGVILVAIRFTRPFGLGLLLASGVGWLILGAICGGVFR